MRVNILPPGSFFFFFYRKQFQYIQIYTSYNRHEENNNFRMWTSEIKRKELHSVGFYIIQDEKSPYRDIVKNEKVGFVLLQVRVCSLIKWSTPGQKNDIERQTGKNSSSTDIVIFIGLFWFYLHCCNKCHHPANSIIPVSYT